MPVPDPNWTVYATTVNAVLQAAGQMGACRDQLLAAAGIDRARLLQRDQRIPVASFFQLYAAAAEATANPDIALTVGRISYYTGLNLQLYMGTRCSSFRDYLNLMPSVLKLRGDIGEVHVQAEGELIRLEWHPLWQATRSQRFLSDEILAASALIVDSLCVFRVPVRRAHLSYPEPADTAELRAVLCDELVFSQAVSCLYFDRKALNYPLIKQDHEGPGEVPSSFADLVGSPADADPFLPDLRRSIGQLLPEGELGIDRVAGQLNVSRRTLQRRLADRSTSFQHEVQGVRQDLAQRYLRDRRLAITEIAFLLGYSDQGSFSGAFKSWYGMSPSDYRAGH